MEQLFKAVPNIIYSIIFLTVLCTIGSIASRKLKFNFAYLSLFSFGVYILIGYYVTLKTNLSIAILSGLIVGFYDATVARKLCIKLGANMGLETEQIRSLTTSKALIIMLFMAPFFTFIGYIFTFPDSP